MTAAAPALWLCCLGLAALLARVGRKRPIVGPRYEVTAIADANDPYRDCWSDATPCNRDQEISTS